MARELRYTVTVGDGDHVDTQFGPGSDVPGWARKLITNPKAWVDGEADDAEDEDPDKGPIGYASMNKADLEAEIDKRNEDRSDDGQIVIGGNGNKPDLIAALEADDAEDE